MGNHGTKLLKGALDSSSSRLTFELRKVFNAYDKNKNDELEGKELQAFVKDAFALILGSDFSHEHPDEYEELSRDFLTTIGAAETMRISWDDFAFKVVDAIEVHIKQKKTIADIQEEEEERKRIAEEERKRKEEEERQREEEKRRQEEEKREKEEKWAQKTLAEKHELEERSASWSDELLREAVRKLPGLYEGSITMSGFRSKLQVVWPARLVNIEEASSSEGSSQGGTAPTIRVQGEGQAFFQRERFDGFIHHPDHFEMDPDHPYDPAKEVIVKWEDNETLFEATFNPTAESITLNGLTRQKYREDPGHFELVRKGDIPIEVASGLQGANCILC